MRQDTPSLFFERWATAIGPARLALMAPLRDLLLEPVSVPPRLELAIEPLRWLLQRAAEGRLRTTAKGELERGFACRWNKELGFISPVRSDDGETYLEIEALFLMAQASGALEDFRGRPRVTGMGDRLLRDPKTLWEAAAATFPFVAPTGVYGGIWEIMLAWLLQPGSEPSAMTDAVRELIEANGTKGQKEDLEETCSVGIFSLYTFARALCMFTPETPGQDRPTLSDCGRATAIAALRALSHITFLA